MIALEWLVGHVCGASLIGDQMPIEHVDAHVPRYQQCLSCSTSMTHLINMHVMMSYCMLAGIMSSYIRKVDMHAANMKAGRVDSASKCELYISKDK